MIDFSFTEEQQALKDLARKFAATEMAPIAAECDRAARFPIEVFKRANALGLCNLHIPEAYGGPGGGLIEECIVSEELAASCAGITVSIQVNGVGTWPILLAGDAAQKKEYLGRIARDGQLVAYCLTEPSAGSDVTGILATARRAGDDYILNGTKQFITNGSLADLYVVFAHTDRTQRHHGMSCFVVERAAPGVQVGKKEDKMGQRASDTVQMVFEDVKVPAAQRLGAEGDGFKIAMQVFDRSRPSIGAIAVGLARRAMECAIAYARERQAFGRPLAEFQGIGFMIAEMAMKLAAARWLCLHAAWLVERGEKCAKEAAFAKAFAADACMEITTNAVQVYGGYGYSKEYPVEKLMRDAKVLQIYEGTTQIQRVIMARELFRAASPSP